MEKKRILALFLSICILLGMALPVSAQGEFEESIVSENTVEQKDEESGLPQQVEDSAADEEEILEQGKQELPEILIETETIEETTETETVEETVEEEVLVDSEAAVPQGSPLTYGVTSGVATARYKQVELSWEAVAEAESY